MLTAPKLPHASSAQQLVTSFTSHIQISQNCLAKYDEKLQRNRCCSLHLQDGVSFEEGIQMGKHSYVNITDDSLHGGSNDKAVTTDTLLQAIQEKGTNESISGEKINSLVSDVIQHCKDPISEINYSPGNSKERPIRLDDVVEFTQFAEEVPQIVIDEYTTPHAPNTSSKVRTPNRGNSRMVGSCSAPGPQSSKASQKDIGIQLGLGFRAQRGASIVRQLFQTTPPLERARMLFHIKPEMNLDELQQKIAYYVFGCELDESEILFNCCGFVLTREKMKCFVPGNEITQEIFVPVLEDTHWYMVVVSFLEQKICWLDTNNIPGLKQGRSYHIDTLVACLSEILPQNLKKYSCPTYNFEVKDLPVEICHGVPYCGNSILSALYVLEWLSMEHSFRSWPYGNIDEDVARMNAMLTLITSPINEEASKIKKQAEKAFSKMKARKSPTSVAK
ncbi:hypothetical protein RIF29_35349 [Crotalaria pallida]|uniref:Ubiquitin-like protease family profile domain-containing protein n=1 Tax=Crotalaria pallida TaxID=3830 RepID=A0AAN9HTR7_CROPI